MLRDGLDCVPSQQQHGERGIILGMLALSFVGSFRTSSNGLLYTEKKFGWTVVDYTNYKSFWVSFFFTFFEFIV